MQTIHINELWCEALIGVYAHERETRQPLRLDLQVDIDAGRAAASDEITDTLDYDTLARSLKEHTESTHYQLVEKLLAQLLEQISRFEQVQSCHLRISKPKALEHLGATVCLSGSFKRA